MAMVDLEDNAKSVEKEYPLLENPPYHVGMIMDGNGRWAKERGKHRLEGHKAGTENLRRILESSAEFGVKMLIMPQVGEVRQMEFSIYLQE